jgi:site-specific recombinase XerC
VTTLAPTLQSFFTERLTRDKNASPHTIASYRDTLRLLLVFLAERTGTAPAQVRIEDLDAPLIGAFLDHLERRRGNSVRSRNTRLAAIHSLFRFAALRHPEHAALIARVLAIPPNAANGRWCPSLIPTRSMRCSPRRTPADGSAAAITPCCWSRSKPGCGSLS